jgi:GWxTD domain-containing protein
MNHTSAIFSVLFFLCSTSYGQALRDVNYYYLYNAETPVDMSIKTVRAADGWKIFYKATVRDTATASSYRIEWRVREALNTKDEIKISSLDTTAVSQLSGDFALESSLSGKIIVAKVINTEIRRAWMFYRILEPNYSVNVYLTPVKPAAYVRLNDINTIVTEQTSKPVFVSYYNDKFPAAAPAFSEALGRVTKGIIPDSSLMLSPGSRFSFFRNGLYLFQQDTSVAQGYAVRAESDYPRYTIVQNLPGPFIYICTKGEYDRLESARGDKKAFDRTVLTITGDPERAKRLIKSYFRRVELANQFFTSYKEGWKTDRGMIYIVFGAPDKVYRFYDKEVWSYDNTEFKVTFDFVKSSTVFDPDNYVLIRDQKYREVWYQMVDLWRNARF